MSHTETTNQVAVIGLGSMGMGVAQSLVRANIPARGFDINPTALESFTQAGGYSAKDLNDAVSNCNVVILMLVNSNQCDAVLFGEHGMAHLLAKGTVVVLGSTTSASYARELNIKLEDMGLKMIDAPVSGGAAKAMTGELSIMASGEPAAFEICAQAFEAISTKLYVVGDDVGAGESVKMINQLLAGVHIASAAEAMALGIKSGLDPEMIYEIICNSAGSSWMFQNRVPHILAGDYTPNSMVDIFVKDLGIVLDAGQEMKFPLPIASSAHQQFLTASAAGYGKEDDSAVIKAYPGVDLPKKK